MANTQISLQLSEGVIIPSQGSVSVVQGDTLTFTNASAGSVTLFFSPAATSALSPSPAAESTIPIGGQLKFEFITSAPGAYSVFFGVAGAPAPAIFPVDSSTSLSLDVLNTGATFGGIVIKTSTGG